MRAFAEKRYERRIADIKEEQTGARPAKTAGRPDFGARAALAIFLLALALRVLYFAQSAENPLLYFPVLDETYYIELGRAIAAGSWIGEERVFFMDPLYGYLLGGLFRLFGENLTTIRLLQIVLDALNTTLIYLLGVRLWTRSAGLAAALIYALYKVAFFYTLLILKTTLAVTLSLVYVLVLLQALEGARPLRWFLLGLLAGAMVFLRANFLLLVPLSALYLLWAGRGRLREGGRQLALYLAGVALLLSAGALRNYLVSGEAVLLSSQAGRLLYCSNNPENLTGRYNVPSFSRPHPEKSEGDFHREAERRLGRALTAGQASAYWRKEALRFLAGDPKSLFLLLGNKLKGTIADHEIPVNHSFCAYAAFTRVGRWPLPTFALVLALGLPGLALGILRRREVAVVFIPLGTVLATVLLFYTSSRFRMPAVPFLVLGSGISLSALQEWFKTGRRGGALGLLLLSALLYTLSVAASQPVRTGAKDFYLSKAYWSAQRYEEARAVASRGARDFPDQARFEVLLGMIALSEGRLTEAAAHNRRALALDPGNADAYHNLGILHLCEARPAEALKAVEKALSLSLESRYLFTLAEACEGMGDRERAARSYKAFLEAAGPSDPFRKEALERLERLR